MKAIFLLISIFLLSKSKKLNKKLVKWSVNCGSDYQYTNKLGISYQRVNLVF